MNTAVTIFYILLLAYFVLMGCYALYKKIKFNKEQKKMDKDIIENEENEDK